MDDSKENIMDNNGEAAAGVKHHEEEKVDKDEAAAAAGGMNVKVIKVERTPLHKLFSFADPLDTVLMIVGTIAAAGNGLCMPLMALLFGALMDSIAIHGAFRAYEKFVYLAFGAGVASFLRERQAARIRCFYLETILRQDIAFFDKEINTGEVVGRMSGDTLLIQDAIGEKVGKFIQFGASFIGGFVISFFKGCLLTLVMLSAIPPLVISGAVMIKIVGKFASQKQTADSLAATVVDQTFGSIRTVASFTGEQQAISRYNKSLVKAYRCSVQEGLATGLGNGASVFIIFSTYGLAMWYGAKLILEKGYSGGDVMSVIFGVLIGTMSLGQVCPSLGAFAAGQAAAFKMYEAINRKPEIDVCCVNGKQLDDIRGDIELRDVNFSYPARPEEQILNGFSLLILNGTTTALVGTSGSGKSTVISLILRFYDPQAGEVLIDGVNLKDLQLKWIREKIGFVSQEPVLFASSIRDNIAYGKHDATNEEIQAAIELANASHFIKNLPQGLDTNVGEHGLHLSGGQKQRIAIARAIIKDPRILFFDEATSSLDVASERMLQEALDRFMINRTTVVISHRLSTIRNADTIIVIQKGKIVEKGTHSELLENLDGAYNRLISLQETIKESEQIAVNHSDIDHPSLSSPKITTPKEYEKQSNFPTAEKEKMPPDASLSRLAYLNIPEVPELLVGATAATVSGIIIPIFGLMLATMVNVLNEPKDELVRHSKHAALMFVALGAASLLSSPLSTYFFAVAGYKLIKRIRLMCFSKIVYMEIGWFDESEHSTGAIGARLSSDAASVRSLVGDTLTLLVQNSATAVAGLVIAFKACWQLSLLILAMFPLLGVTGYIQVKSMKGFSTNAKKMYEEASQVASDAVGSIRTIASFCAEEKVMKLYKKKCEGPVKAGIRQGFISGIGFGLSFFIFFMTYAVTFYVGAKLVDHNKATFSEVFRVFFALSMTAIGLSQESTLASDARKAKSSVASVFGLIDQTSRIDSSESTGMTLENLTGEVQFLHVSFKYPTRPHIEVFHDLCLTVPPGKTIALVGESGSGKSTVISLLLRFYDPNSGHITLDGIEIQNLQLKWLRQQMGLVSQEPVLFSDTIRANIAYGKEEATEADILAAAELANAHSFISGLQQGYDTSVGERGVQLSGGQKQRVAIARAIVKEPKILLLDEATSALDSESERVVQDALDQVMVDRTTLVVAHRLSTVKNADLIAVVSNGMIVEKGSHETLINIKNGIYSSWIEPHTST